VLRIYILPDTTTAIPITHRKIQRTDLYFLRLDCKVTTTTEIIPDWTTVNSKVLISHVPALYDAGLKLNPTQFLDHQLPQV
jgi:hypothetical protein